MTKRKIFISYAWEDKAVVRRLEDELLTTDAEVWIDHSHIRGGHNLTMCINDALEWCNTLLLIWSKAARRSRWVKIEWTSANSIPKPIIPCLLDETKLPPILLGTVYVDFRNFDQGLEQLLRALKLFTINPFIHGRAVKPPEFVGRKQELKDLFSDLIEGRSTAITGQHRIGKTSLLYNVLNEKTRQERLSGRFDRFWFNYLDAQTLHDVRSISTFWERALTPLERSSQTGQPKRLQALTKAYQIAKVNKFNSQALDQLFVAFRANGLRYVLLLDEFDDLLMNQALNNAKFYGGLSSWASCAENDSGLVLVIAARHDLKYLREQTRAINPGMSHFNVFNEYKLGAFEVNEISALLDKGRSRFNQRDRNFVREISGGHPYIAQKAAALLWDAHENGLRDTARYEAAGQRLCRETENHYASTWLFWPKELRFATAIVALTQIPRLVGKPSSLAGRFVDELAVYNPKLEALMKASGMLAQGDNGEWSIAQNAFLWWLANEFWGQGDWLKAQKMDGLFSRQKQRHWMKIEKDVRTAIGKGAVTLIEAAAKKHGE